MRRANARETLARACSSGEVCTVSCSLRSFCLAALGLFCHVFSASAADRPARSPRAHFAKIETFAAPDGQRYFALELMPSIAEPPRPARDVAILFDTSASQTGSYRDKALAALDWLLAGLDDGDRVTLLAVDVQAIPLTPTFVYAHSAEMSRALAQLRARVPLGSTDMPGALAAAAMQLTGGAEADRARSAVYIGDGMSTAKLLFTENMRRLMERFVEARISVSSYSIGPRVDHQLLGAIAHHTGGILLSDREEWKPSQIGASLADVVRATVIWPSAVKLPEGYWQVYFRAMPPLRFDRDTVLLGKMPATAGNAAPVEIEVQGEAGGKPLDLKWKLTPQPSDPENAYLAKLVEAARRDGGLSLPTVGAAGLSELRGLVSREAARLVLLGQQALALGEIDRAERFVREAKRLDPLNAQAGALEADVQTVQRGGRAKPYTLPLELRPVGTVARRDAAAGGASSQPADASLLDEVAKQHRVYKQFFRNEVRNSVQASRAMRASDPEGAAKMLKLLLEKVAQAPELDADLRSQLSDYVEASFKAARQQAIVKAERARLGQRLGDEGRPRTRPNPEIPVQDQKIDELLERFNALMDEEHYRDAAADAGAANRPPRAVSAANAELTAHTAGYAAGMNAVVDARHKAEIDSMHQVESSLVPTPDEPPLVYPDANVWRVLSERRKKYQAADLAESSPNDAKLVAALDEKTELDCVAQPLSEVVDYLKARHGIEIQFDDKALSDQGIGTDTPVTRKLKGITLRSALRLLLSEMDLTYVIRSQVLLITTKAEAETMRSSRVYPVPDLAAPLGTPGTGLGRRGLGRGF